MQEATAAFEDAVEAPEVAWLPPVLLADWLDDGATQISAGQPAFLVELFDRDSSSTWGSPDPDRPGYTHVGGVSADYDTVEDSRIGRHRYAAVNTNRASYFRVASQSMRVSATFTISAAPAGAGEILYSVVLAGDGTGVNHYMATFEINAADSTIDIQITERDNAVNSSLGALSDALAYVHGHTYAVVAELDTEDLFLRAKFWDASIEIEPNDWMLEDNLNDVINSGGFYGGVRTEVPSGITTPTTFYIHTSSLRILDGSIDDLSDIAGQITVSQAMDDGLPSEVSFVSDSGTSVVMNADVVDGRRGMRATEYLSQFNQRSPLYALDRDVAPVTLDHGIVTDDGPERVRLFTGQMVDLPIGTDQVGHMQAMSANRLRLSQLVQPPPFNRFGDLSATWAVSWAAYECGVYAAPPPSSGGVWYAPLHGSMMPFLDFNMPLQALYNVVFPALNAGYYRDVGAGELELVTFGDDPESAPAYIDGPYVAAPNLQYTSEKAIGIYYDFPAFANAADGSFGLILSEEGPRGRFEFIVRGDAFATTGPSGANFTPTTFILLFAQENVSGNGSIYCGISMSRRLRIEMSDGTASINVNANAALDLPTDGEWYKYGVAWDFVTETAYFFRKDPDGTEHTDSSTNAALDVTRLPDSDEPFTPAEVQPFNTDILSGFLNPYMHSFLPCSELHITAGPKANPNTMPWMWQNEFNAGAIIKRSATRLRAIAEPTEREAWEYIGSFAQAEMAALRLDEHDRLVYMTPAFFAEAAQQTAGQTLSTALNVAELVPQIDPSRIRNQVRVNYQEARFDTLYGPVYQSREVIAIPPGTSSLIIPLDVLTTQVDVALATLPTSAQVDSGVSSFISGGWHTFFTINTSPSGTGTFFSGPSNPSTDFVVMQVEDIFTANQVTVSVINRTGVTLYTANDNPEVPTINIGGIGMYLTSQSAIKTRASSVARRGTRGLTVDSPVHQRREDATRLAKRLLNELAEPSPTLENVRVFADPRRQPGDMVSFDDAANTAVSGLWRLLAVRHVIDGSNNYQVCRLKQAPEVGQWGSSRWGQCLYGREGV